MTAVVTVESVVLGIVVVVVIGLLRAYGEILRAQSDGSAASSPPDAAKRQSEPPFQVREGLPAPNGVAGSPAHDVVGVNIDGGGVKVAVPRSGGLTLLAFLSSGCLTCADFWHTFRDGVSLPAGAREVIVTRDLTEESLSKLRALAGGATLVVASTAAWQDYGVPGSPFFVLADVDHRSGSWSGHRCDMDPSGKPRSPVPRRLRPGSIDRREPQGPSPDVARQATLGARGC